jgi:hypothetical protein
MAVELQSIDFAAGEVTTSDNRILPIVDLFDARGRPTLASHHAILCVAGDPGGWVSFKLAEFDRSKLQ